MSIWRPHTTAILISGVVLIVVGSAIAFMVSQLQPPTEIRMGSGVFQARVVSDEAGRERGLSGVGSMRPTEALLMVFESDDTWDIWMKDMQVSIDIVWLNKDKEVVYIVRNAPPEDQDTVYQPKDAARYVIELQAGAAQAHNIKVGETAIFTTEAEKVE